MIKDKKNDYLLSVMLKQEEISDTAFFDLEKQYHKLSFGDKEILLKEVVEFVTLPENSWFFKLHRKTFVVWVVDWVWNYMNNYGLGILAEIIPRTAFCAAVQGIPTVEQIVSRLWYEKDDTVGVRDNYEVMRSGFFSSEEKIGTKNGRDYLLSDLVEDFRKLNSQVDSLSMAEFRVELLKIISETLEGDLKGCFLSKSKEDVVENIVDVINFFTGTDVEKVLFVCAGIMRADAYLDFSEKVSQDQIDVSGGANLVVNQINSKFPKTATGEYEDIDGVMAELDKLATEKGDDTIRDLYYFNESTGKFEWKE